MRLTNFWFMALFLIVETLGMGCGMIVGIDDIKEDPRDRCNDLNGCKRDDAVSFVNASGVIGYGFDAQGFSPPCMLVSRGAEISFRGTFEETPLKGGEVWNNTGTVDPENPINHGTVTDGAMNIVISGEECIVPIYLDVQPESIPGAIFVQ